MEANYIFFVPLLHIQQKAFSDCWYNIKLIVPYGIYIPFLK